MRECPWCGHRNLNVYAYCQACGRGFSAPDTSPHLPGFWTEYLGAWLAPPTEGVSPWPIYAAIAGLVFGPMLLWHARSGPEIAAVLAGATATIGVLALLTWLAGIVSARRNQRPGQIELVESAFVIRWPLDARHVNRRLQRLRGVRTAAIEAGDVQSTIIVVHEDRLDAATIRGAIERELPPRTHVAGFEPRPLGQVGTPSVRMGLPAAFIAVAGLILGGLAATGGFAMFQGEGGAAGPPAAPPGTGVTTIVAQNLSFQQQVVRVAAGATVTLTLDNRDAGVPHNIEFFDSPTPGEGNLLGGCTSGCAEADTLATAVAPGPVTQTFTFTAPATPGTYGYWCVVHTTTMRGTLIVE